MQGNLFFRTGRLAEDDSKFDLILSFSCLSYVPDWMGMLKEIAEKEPEYFILGRTLVCSEPLAALRQRVWSDRNPGLVLGETPAWIFSRELLASRMRDLGYELTHFVQGGATPQYFTEAVPPGYRDARECAMLFERAR